VANGDQLSGSAEFREREKKFIKNCPKMGGGEQEKVQIAITTMGATSEEGEENQ
jgi:hypothetical protein